MAATSSATLVPSTRSVSINDANRQQARLMEEALSVVNAQSFYMKRCLENHALMDALKHCSTMLSELRTSLLSPKHYYELYTAVFDTLQYLSHYLHDTHLPGKTVLYSPRQLADLYELVQYAGNIVPRLYLMITVGAVYMATKETPAKVVLRDMMEMSRGVQHPLRGLFLRYYLSSVTKDSLPDDTPESASESIQFILMNFTEMNKLWVRMQYQGGTRDIQKREAERQELRILVGSPLVRLSQLDSVNVALYKSLVLPRILEQIVNCRDKMAQEYLMEIVIQVFGDPWHLRTIQDLLLCIVRLSPDVKVVDIMVGLMDRLRQYIMDGAAASELAKAVEKIEIAPSKGVNDERMSPGDGGPSPAKKKVGQSQLEKTDGTSDQEASCDTAEEENNPPMHGKETGELSEIDVLKKVQLFEKFWESTKELCTTRSDIPMEDITQLCLSMVELTLKCYPNPWDYLEQIWGFCKVQVEAESRQGQMQSARLHLEKVLSRPLSNKECLTSLLSGDSRRIQGYRGLLNALPHGVRRSVSLALIETIIADEIYLSTGEQVTTTLDLLRVLIEDQSENCQDPPKPDDIGDGDAELSGEDEDTAIDQGQLCKLLHFIWNEDEDAQFLLWSAARRVLGRGGRQVCHTFPCLVYHCTRLADRYKSLRSQPEWHQKCVALYKFIHQIITTVYAKTRAHTLCLKLFLIAAQSASDCGFEEVTYEFFVQAFTVYEESISESRAQFTAISLLIGTLQTCRVFDEDNYDTITTKCALHASKLLKRADQCRAVTLCSHLFWQTRLGWEKGDTIQAAAPHEPSSPEQGGPSGNANIERATQDQPGSEGHAESSREEDEPDLFMTVQGPSKEVNKVHRKAFRLYRDPRRVLECLQKALRIADSCLGACTNLELFVEILNRYVYFYEKQNPSVTVKYLNGLIRLIATNLHNLGPADDAHQEQTTHLIHRHFRNTLEAIEMRKGEDSGVDYSKVDTSWLYKP